MSATAGRERGRARGLGKGQAILVPCLRNGIQLTRTDLGAYGECQPSKRVHEHGLERSHQEATNGRIQVEEQVRRMLEPNKEVMEKSERREEWKWALSLYKKARAEHTE